MDDRQLYQHLISNNPPNVVHPNMPNIQSNNNYYNSVRANELKLPLLKRSLFLNILAAYIVYLAVAGACLIYLFASVPALCNKYTYFFIPLLCSFVLLMTGAIVNIYNFKIKKIGQSRVSFYSSSTFFVIGGLARLGWAVWSIIIYDQNYGDCYLPYKNQLGMIICSAIEILLIWIIECAVVRNEKKIARVSGGR